jgi:hypothetical protein
MLATERRHTSDRGNDLLLEQTLDTVGEIDRQFFENTSE